MASPERPRAAFIGLGIMGRPMAASLARAGFETFVWNRTRTKAEELAAEHDLVTVADSPAAAAEAEGTAISMVPDAADVEAVMLGAGGAVEGLRRGDLAIDMSTIAPSASRRVGERLAEGGIAFLDAPVTGSRPKAADATLTIMAGGEADAFERARPLFEAMGALVLHVGPQGQWIVGEAREQHDRRGEHGGPRGGHRARARRRARRTSRPQRGGRRLRRVGDARAEVGGDGRGPLLGARYFAAVMEAVKP